jgi:cytochrome c oxidase subunit 2
VSCHRNDTKRRAPVLEGLYGQPVQLETGETVLAEENYLRESILNPNAKVVAGFEPIMPSFAGQLNEDQLFELIAYLRSLGGQQPGVPPRSAPGPVAGATPSLPTVTAVP